MYHSLSYYKIEKKWKIQRRKKKNTNLNYPKLQNEDETYPKLCISPIEPHGGIYRHQGKGGQGQTLAQSTGVAVPYGRENAAQATFL